MTRRFAVPLAMALLSASVANAATSDELIATIRAVGPKGEGHVAAIAAVRELSAAPPESLPTLLKAFDGSSPLAANWLLGVVETIADRALQQKQLPARELEAFIVETGNHPAARRVAYEWLIKVDATATDRLIPGMLQDPSPDFRRDAVAQKLKVAAELLAAEKKPEAQAAFQEALSGAVDDDQVKAIVTPLRELGAEVDLQKHFGFLVQWKLIGPFDNTDLKGFDVAYPPERELNFTATYPGKSGEVQWQEAVSKDEYGVVDLRKEQDHHKGAITYAAATFSSAQPQQVEVRLGTPNAWKLWVNGELVFARDEYHRGKQLDQYRVPVALKAGPNTILLKVCQNEQKEEWAQDWEYQLRICNSAGAAIAPSAPQTSGRDAVPRR